MNYFNVHLKSLQLFCWIDRNMVFISATDFWFGCLWWKNDHVLSIFAIVDTLLAIIEVENEPATNAYTALAEVVPTYSTSCVSPVRLQPLSYRVVVGKPYPFDILHRDL